MNKNILTNGLALLLVLIGYFLNSEILLTMGLFALSGALTNWLAIHMLFEKVPGLYGSGIIPARFEEFKAAIANLMMREFFNQQNIERFMAQNSGKPLNLAPVIDKVDLEPSFHALVDTVTQSPTFGPMLEMFGGAAVLMPLKDEFIGKMKTQLADVAQSDKFQQLLADELSSGNISQEMQSKIASMVQQRLDELTPQLVKEMVQQLIAEHLGWLVVWGGVFGGLIGLISALLL